jgi:hypothetical protein
MTGDGGFLVEDFLDAVSAQLDRTQDALAAKAKVRPLMFALRTLSLDLQVFVTMGDDGTVRLRSAQPGETGSSTLKLDFTTITRPMVEENTVSLAMAQAPTLQEAGLDQQQQHALERVGVRNVAQLQALRSSGAGVDGIARLTEGLVPADRLRTALRFGRPELLHVAPVPPAPAPAAPAAPAPAPPVVLMPPGTQRLQVVGRNLLARGVAPTVRLAGQPLETSATEDDGLIAHLPPGLSAAGALEIDLGDEEPVRYHLAVEDGNGKPAETWLPEAVS